MKCSMCKKEGKIIYIKHKECHHYVCTGCASYSLLNLNYDVTLSMCNECYDENYETDYDIQCQTCGMKYDEQHTRKDHCCNDDLGIFDI